MPNIVGYLLKFILIFAAYFITAKIGLSLDAVSGFATLVWAPSGIALAALVLFGMKLWPAIFLAAFLVNLITGAPILVALGMGAGNTLEALIGTYLLNKFINVDTFLDYVKDVVVLTFGAAFFSTTISATIGVTSLYLGGIVPGDKYLDTWAAWWAGDMLGILVVSPFLITWSKFSFSTFKIKYPIESAVFILTIIFANLFIIFRVIPELLFIQPRLYYIFPVLLWAGLRFDRKIVTAAIVCTSISTLIATINGVGSFASPTLSLTENLLNLQTFLVVMSIMILSLSAVVSERERAKKKLEAANLGLDQKVKEQTANLQTEIDQRKKSEERLREINSLMVGRELKMIEMEKQLKERLKK